MLPRVSSPRLGEGGVGEGGVWGSTTPCWPGLPTHSLDRLASYMPCLAAVVITPLTTAPGGAILGPIREAGWCRVVRQAGRASVWGHRTSWPPGNQTSCSGRPAPHAINTAAGRGRQTNSLTHTHTQTSLQQQDCLNVDR